MRGSRSKAREAALKVLYQLDVTKDSPQEGCLLYFRHHRVSVNSQPFVTALVQGTVEHQAQIDPLLTQYATNWTLSRMSIVDRNVLRLATFELLFSEETPPKVVINEAVDLAKRFGTPDSGKFVNGVLDAIHKSQKGSDPSGGQVSDLSPFPRGQTPSALSSP